jgi:hypothetical protein
MKRTMPVLLCAVLLLSVCAWGKDLEFTTIAHASAIVIGTPEEGITDRVGEVIHDQASLDAYWETIYPNDKERPKPPRIDFTSEMVIIVSPGAMPTGGYTTEITKIADTGSALEVTVVTKRPSPDEFVIQVFTRPYHIVRLATSGLPVSFTWTQE